jgi:hypothetical protein
MVEAWLEGYQVVNAVRHDRSSDGLMKRLSSEGFYSLFLKLSKLQVQFNASDFRLIDRDAVQAILACEERVRFSKGFFAWIGYQQKTSTSSDLPAAREAPNGEVGSYGTMPSMASSTFPPHHCASGATSA